MPKRTAKAGQVPGEAGGPVVGRMADIPMDAIREPELPARETMDGDKLAELKDSMRAIGLQQPILVFEVSTGFEVIAGHRRYLAARELSWPNIRAIVYPAGFIDRDAVMIHENVIREDLNPAQEAVFYAQLIERRSLDEAGICALVKRSPDYIADRLKLLRGSEKVFAAVRDGEISLRVARALNRFPDRMMGDYYLDCAIRAGTSGPVVEQWLRDYLAQQGAPQTAHHAVRTEAVALQTEIAKPACFLCGGALDPYNLVSVYIHKWELREIREKLDVRNDEPETPSAPAKPEREN
jgi:ParB/RepB/Spo0J family partition protein